MNLCRLMFTPESMWETLNTLAYNNKVMMHHEKLPEPHKESHALTSYSN